jgi:CheY-like chemotaxis protein
MRPSSGGAFYDKADMESLSRRKVLVADDEPAVRAVVTRSLREAGYDVTAAEDGWSAWREAQNQGFDLVITDHAMPNMTGSKLVKRLRERYPALPIIMITGYFAEPDTPGGLPNDVLLIYKPFSSDSLLTQVQRMLEAPPHLA